VTERSSHFDETGAARMVDVSDKPVTARVARAGAAVAMQPETLAMIKAGQVGKGDVLAVARLAGIMAAKRTSDLIPLCHPLALTGVDIAFEPDEAGGTLEITATARIAARTGVEMEAMTAASVAALTIYDMCKSVDRGMVIGSIRLLHKSGGKSGSFDRP
jgi:cyclic pyranopterin phosphate synthase